tara:strand:- start:100 stop:468 length:369 start_codon:yes stop_codon:yes gene_type:complete
MPNYIDPKILGSLLGGVGPMSNRDMSISEAQKALLAEANKKSGTMTDQDYSAYGNLAAPSIPMGAAGAAGAISDIEQLAAQSALGMKAEANPYLDQAVSKADGRGGMTDQDVDELIATYGGK